MNEHELKGLQVQLTQVRQKLDAERGLAAEHQKEVANLVGKERELNKKIEAIKEAAKDPIVTEHAILRYFERVLGYDLEKIKAKILPDNVKAMMKQMNATSGKYPVKDEENGSFRVIIKNNALVSIEFQ